jgi:hypothetical protein
MTYTRVTFEATTRVMTLMEAANVLDAEESRLRPSSPIRERILAAAGGNPGSTP